MRRCFVRSRETSRQPWRAVKRAVENQRRFVFLSTASFKYLCGHPRGIHLPARREARSAGRSEHTPSAVRVVPVVSLSHAFFGPSAKIKHRFRCLLMPQFVSDYLPALENLPIAHFPTAVSPVVRKGRASSNLIAKIRCREPCSGIVRREDTVVSASVNALLSRHNFILLDCAGMRKRD